MKQFFTREQANEGIKLPLSLPDGTPTEYFIQIRGADSDLFRREERKSIRELVALRQKYKEEDDNDAWELTQEEQEIKLVAKLVIGWNLEEDGKALKCTEANVVKFLTNAPLIRDEINRAAANRRLFFVKGSGSSSDTPKGSTDSKRSRKARSKA